jgi:hypothetical protein
LKEVGLDIGRRKGCYGLASYLNQYDPSLEDE